MNKAQETLKKMIEDLEAQLVTLRAQYDNCTHPALEIEIAMMITQVESNRQYLIRFRDQMGWS